MRTYESRIASCTQVVNVTPVTGPMERVSERSLATPGVVAWRTRHSVGVLLGASIVLVGLTLLASHADPSTVDVGATRWLQQFHNPAFATLMVWVSWFGFAPQTWVLPVIVALPFAVRGLRVEALWVVGTQAAALVVLLIKDLVHRQRPSPDVVAVLAQLNSPSFPSGHVVQYTMLFGFTIFLVYALVRRGSPRTLALSLLAVPILLVGPSRMYLGQHWLSDVLGGYAVATLLLVPFCWAYARWRLDIARGQFAGSARPDGQFRIGPAELS